MSRVWQRLCGWIIGTPLSEETWRLQGMKDHVTSLQRLTVITSCGVSSLTTVLRTMSTWTTHGTTLLAIASARSARSLCTPQVGFCLSGETSLTESIQSTTYAYRTDFLTLRDITKFVLKALINRRTNDDGRRTSLQTQSTSAPTVLCRVAQLASRY